MSSAGTTTPIAELLRDLVRSRVLGQDRVDRLYENAPPSLKWDSVKFADHLVAIGVLTRFQADKLLRGHWRGLALAHYRLLGPLGRGGMGIVYLARTESEGPPVALKILPPTRAAEEPRMLARFLRESAIGRGLPPHPNLTRTIDAGEYHGVHYLAMEYVPGKTVRQLVNESGSLSIGQAARVFSDIAAGLHAAHTAGFVHRDLKPANVIVMPDGRAKLLDFGFALLQGEPAPTDPTILGGPGYTLGTLDYLPPEQVDDAASVGPAADLYALGCSLFYALAGCPPFPGGTARDKIRWHKSDSPPPVTQFNPDVPDEFERFIERLMAKEPYARPRSAEEVARHLARWAEPVVAKPVPTQAGAAAEMLKQVEARWQVLQATSTEDESLDLVDDSETAPAARMNVPRRLIWLVAGALAVAIAAALGLGWLVARLLTN